MAQTRQATAGGAHGRSRSPGDRTRTQIAQQARAPLAQRLRALGWCRRGILALAFASMSASARVQADGSVPGAAARGQLGLRRSLAADGVAMHRLDPGADPVRGGAGDDRAEALQFAGKLAAAAPGSARGRALLMISTPMMVGGLGDGVVALLVLYILLSLSCFIGCRVQVSRVAADWDGCACVFRHACIIGS